MKSLPKVGDMLIHKVFGKGLVSRVSRGAVTLKFGKAAGTFQWCASSENFRRAPFINPWMLALRRLHRLSSDMPCECWRAKGKNIVLVAPCTNEVILRCRTAKEAKLLAALHANAYNLVRMALIVSKQSDADLRRTLNEPHKEEAP